jgi:hypothetical protein
VTTTGYIVDLARASSEALEWAERRCRIVGRGRFTDDGREFWWLAGPERAPLPEGVTVSIRKEPPRPYPVRMTPTGRWLAAFPDGRWLRFVDELSEERAGRLARALSDHLESKRGGRGARERGN